MEQPEPNKKNVVLQVASRKPSQEHNRFSIKSFVIVFLFMAAVLAWLSWSSYDLYTQHAIIQGQVLRAEELRGAIIHLDEVLTMSARMAAATGDPQWEARYRRFEPPLGQAIKEIMKLAPSEALSQTDAANMKLVEMENHALTLVRENHAAEARTVLGSEKYETQKGVYAIGMTGFFNQLQGQLQERQQSERIRAVFSAGAGIAALTILLFSWLAVIRRMYKTQTALLSNITKRQQTEEVLLTTQSELEARVQERTTELTTANTTLVKQIAERGQVEASLRESEERYRELFENAQDAIYVHDVNGNYLSVNAAAERLTDYSRDEIIGRNFVEFMAPEYAERIRANVGLKLDGVERTAFEIEVLAKNGRRVPVEISTRPIYEKGIVIGVQRVARDITERKEAEAERAVLLSKLESERSRLVDIFTHAPAFIASLHGPDHVFELANAHYYELVGHRDLIGRKVRDAFPEVEGQGFFELLDAVYATAVPFVGNEMPVELALTPGAPLELRYMNLVYQPLKDVEGTVSGIICHGVDVTEQVLSRRRLEETEGQLRQSQKLESVGMLAGGIAHDFNNLLTVITGYSELSLKRLDKADPLARNVEEIKKAAERATSLTRQLLAFSRKQMLQPKVLDLNAIILDIERMLGRLVGEDMELRALPGVGLGKVKADPGQIEQVILNLVVNARDAMPKGGKITLETANIYLDEAYVLRHIGVQSGWYAMLAVTDTGDGMDAETQKHIFEPFFTTKEQGKGTGLGLSTVYGIVKQTGGNVWVYSEVGIGTSFKIYLPLIDEPVMESDSEVLRPQFTASTETILLAEDEEMVRNLARDSLNSYGYTVLEAATASEALLISQQHVGPIHLLLTDVVMPRMSGRDLADQLVSLRPDTRVLYMSGYTDQAIVNHGILDVDIAFIGKPFTPDALVLRVREVLQPDEISSHPLEASAIAHESKDWNISSQLNELDKCVTFSSV